MSSVADLCFTTYLYIKTNILGGLHIQILTLPYLANHLMAPCDDYMWVGSGPAPDPACEFIDPIYDDPYDVSDEQKKNEKEHEKLCLE